MTSLPGGNTYRRMSLIVRLTALLLLATWLPASSHEWLEDAGWIHGEQHAKQEAGHDAADGHCRLERGVVLVKAPTLTPQPGAAFAAEEFLGIVVRPRPYPAPLAVRGTAPPEWLPTWSFSRRMALPSRAPSVVA